MNQLLDNDTHWYISVVVGCGVITFYSLPDAVPFLVRMTMTVLAQVGIGVMLRSAAQELNHDF